MRPHTHITHMINAPSALHVANLGNMLWLRKEARRSPEQAAVMFAMTSAAAAFYKTLSDEALDALVCELDLSLFVPRYDAAGLLSALADAGHAKWRTGQQSDLELSNLRNLQALRDACRRGCDAVWVYRIDQETADAYGRLEHRQVVALCESLATSALVPRYDPAEVLRIVEKPAGTRSFFATAYETDIAVSNEAARRSLYLTH